VLSSRQSKYFGGKNVGSTFSKRIQITDYVWSTDHAENIKNKSQDGKLRCIRAFNEATTFSITTRGATNSATLSIHCLCKLSFMLIIANTSIMLNFIGSFESVQ